jgi:exopolysaccharide production protein ExoY
MNEDSYAEVARDYTFPERQFYVNWHELKQIADRTFENAADLAIIFLSFLLLVFISPLLVFIATAIKIDSFGPVIFRQRRVGLNGVTFQCYKFRTMRRDATQALERLLVECPDSRLEWEHTRKLRKDPRITRVGHFLRKSSLDELPQLVNVLMRTMNLVGPRPIVPDEARLYGRSIRHYCSVRPGITGSWQVSGRSNTSFARRVAHDRHYAQRRSFLLDCQILVFTLPAVILGRGAC